MLWRAILGIGRGIANARARSVAAPIANREPQKSTAEGRKCSQLFSGRARGRRGGSVSLLQQSLVVDGEVALRARVAGISLSQPLDDGEAIAEGFQRLNHVALRHKDLWADDIAFLCACRLPLDTPVDRQQQTQIGGNLARARSACRCRPTPMREASSEVSTPGARAIWTW